jgi:multiple sugar transport system permease protein
VTSLRPEADLTLGGLPSSLTLDAYRTVLGDSSFLRAALNSLLVAAATTFFALCITAPAAFATAKLSFPGRSILLLGSLAVSMFPPVATVSPLYLALRSLGLLDSLAGLVVPYTTFASPLALWLLTTTFRDVPDVLYRAARVDGCSPFRIFHKVFLPLALPGLATSAILVFVFSWNEFLYALTFVSAADKRTIPVAISLFANEYREPWVQIAAASVVATMPLLLFTLLFQRRIVAGLMAGSVKE